jgi:hypothetical protein
MAAAQLVFEGQTFQIARRSLVSARELFAENLRLLEKPYDVRALQKRISGCFWRRSRVSMSGAASYYRVSFFGIAGQIAEH